MIVLMVDGLRARALGAYGNTSFPTPACDRLAAGSVLFDRCLAESNQLADIYDALWTGRHALAHKTPTSNRSLIDELADQGYLCHLITDEPEVSNRPDTDRFEEITLIDTTADGFAAEVFDTGMGRVLEAAADLLGQWSAEYEQPRLLWVHLRGLLAPWDAPPAFAESLVDEDDPQLSPSIEVPEGAVASGEEGADESFLAGCRYAGQVMALDRCIGALNDLLAELWPESPPTLLVAGTRGFALGEHGRLGTTGNAYRELFHVPLLVRGEALPAMVREQGLVQTSDMYDLLLRLARGVRPVASPRLVASGTSGNSRYLQTDEWQYVTRAGDDAMAGLYVEPDDLWQANDLAARLPEELQQFENLIRNIDACIEAGEPWHELSLPFEQPVE